MQLRTAVEAVFRSWNGPRAVAYREREGIDHRLGTAVNVQAMVFGNRDDNSGTGVGFTRNAATGENEPYGDFLVNAQGEDVVAGIRITEPRALADGSRTSTTSCSTSSSSSRRTIATCATPSSPSSRASSGCCRSRVGKRTGAAALRMAVEMTTGPPASPLFSRGEAVAGQS